jgi:MFS family permease
MFKLPRAVWLLGWVSLATDAAGEAVYPLLPFFLTTVLGAGAVSLGVIEGAAEAVNSLLKIISGRIADKSPAKRPLVLLGYSVSAAVKPFIALATGWIQVFTIRVLDRVGKGVRGAPRDAMLASWATESNRGQVYGVHQAMDNLGAVIGPALATVFLLAYPGRYRTLFALTIIPGVISVLLILLIPERDGDVRLKPDAATGGSVGSGFSRTADSLGSTTSSGALPPSFKRFMIILGIFSLGNSTDAFLLLRLTEASGSARFVPLMWAGIHVVKTAVSFVGGGWSDRIGRRAVISIGWIVYAVVYTGFAFSSGLTSLLVWFLIYGLYFGFAEGTEKALVADLAPASWRGTAFGIYDAVTGLGALAASIVFGVVWSWYGAPAAFGVGAALSLVATTLLFIAI